MEGAEAGAEAVRSEVDVEVHSEGAEVEASEEEEVAIEEVEVAVSVEDEIIKYLNLYFKK